MAELVKKFKIYSNIAKTTETAKIYTTIAELIPGKPNMPAVVDDIQGYVQLDDLDTAHATRGRVYRNADAKTYQICSQALVPYGEQAYTTPGAFTFTVPAGVTKVKVALAAGGSANPNNSYDGHDGWDWPVWGNPSKFDNIIVNSPNTGNMHITIDCYGYALGFEGARTGRRQPYGAGGGDLRDRNICNAGEYKVVTIDVIPQSTHPVIVGAGGFAWTDNSINHHYEGTGGFVLIAWGGDIS